VCRCVSQSVSASVNMSVHLFVHIHVQQKLDSLAHMLGQSMKNQYGQPNEPETEDWDILQSTVCL